MANEENIVEIQDKKYDLNKLNDEELLKLHEYIVKKGNSLMRKIDKLISEKK